MKKFLAILLSCLLVCSAMLVSQAQGEIPFGCHSLKANMSLGGSDQLLDTAKAALLYELNSDTLLYSWNPDMQIDPTGLVKFMTVLVALENGNIYDRVTVTRAALNSVEIGAVSVELQAGEELTLRNLLYCVMVASANDAAAVIAEHIGGSQAGFVAMMNEKAAELGCTNTQFADPHGLASQGQFSTARDLAIITEAALENSIFLEMFGAKTYTVPATEQSGIRELNTTNHMMSTATNKNYLDERVTGGKPAASSLTDRSMICTAEVGNSRFLSVVISAEATVTETDSGMWIETFGNFEETKALLDYGFDRFVVRQIVDKSQIFDQYAVAGGENHVSVQPAEDVFTALPKDYSSENIVFYQQMDPNALQAPIKKGQVLGTLQISYGSTALGSCPLVAASAVAVDGTVITPALPPEDGDDISFFDHPAVKWVVFGLLGVAVLAISVFLIVRLARSARIKALHRKRRRARRRSR